MKRIIPVWIACAVLALVLAGCRTASSSASVQPGSASPAVSSSSDASAVSQSSSFSQAKSDAPASSAHEKIDGDSFSDMMNGLTGYQPGTAGDSLKLYIAACGMLNFSEGYSTSQEQALRDALEQALSSMDQQKRETLAEIFPAVDSAARNILKNGVESMSDILSDAGNPNLYDSYTSERYDQVASILAEYLNSDD